MGTHNRVAGPSVFREFGAKLLVLLLVLQVPPARGQDLEIQTTGMPATRVQTNSVPVAPPVISPFRTGAPMTPPAGLLPKGAKPMYVPVSPGDPLDPYVAAEATALGNNPNQIFAFVRDQIRFEAYIGSVRGARGTLWAGAGNTLDKASLLVGLLGAAGYTAQYEHASIGSSTFEYNLLQGMFPQTSKLIGCVPQGVAIGNPGYNGNANYYAADYYWVQYGPSNISLDPNMPGAQPGQSFQTSDSSFTTVPQNLRQQVTIKINAEIYSQASSLFGGGPGTTTVLTQSYDASALVGNIVTAGNLVTGSGGGGLDISATTFTYTPYLFVGSGGPDLTQDPVITGTPYQELYTNFPLGSQVLTGLFLEVDADDITDTQQVYTHTILDRLGPAARQGNASVNLNLPSPPAPALTSFDLTTVNINTARQPTSTIQAQQSRLSSAYNNYQAIKAQLLAVPTSGTLTDSQQATVQQGVTLGQYMTIAENELITMSYNASADVLAGQLQTGYYSRVYPNSPRLTIAQTAYNGGNTTVMLDVLKNDMVVIGGLWQSANAPYYEEVERGQTESLMESTILKNVTGQTSVGIGEVFAALGNPNLLTVVTPATSAIPSNPEVLNSTTLSADAQTLILNDVAAGNVVIAPNQMVTVNGITTAGWWETDPNGHTISHFVNGGHQAIAEYAAVQVVDSLGINPGTITWIGKIEGFAVVGIQFAAAILSTVATPVKSAKSEESGVGIPGGDPLGEFLKQFQMDLEITNLIVNVELPEGIGLIGDFVGGLKEGIKQAAEWVEANVPLDPEVLKFIGTPLGPAPGTPTPGTTPGVQLGAITVDPQFTMPVNGNQLPLVFDLPITNTGPSTDTFNIAMSTLSQYFQAYPSVGSLTLLGGQTGMVNVCVVPTDSTGATLPPVGQAQNYVLTVTSATNSSVTTQTQPSFNSPAIPSVEISTDPPTLSLSPGGTVSANLNLASVGNVATGPVTLTAAPPAGITVNSLTSPVSVPLNGVASEALSFTAASNVATGSYNIPFTASYTPSGGTAQQFTMAVPVAVAALGTCAATSATLASQLGKTSLAADLAELVVDMNAAAPSNTVLATSVVAEMHLIINNELTAAYFQSVVPSLTAATNAVASASSSTLLSALGSLNSALCSLSTLLNQANTTSTSLSLHPSSALADENLAVGPNQPAIWQISIANTSSVLHVYNLSTTGVPSGFTVQFSQPSITLGPAASSFSTTLTLTPGASFTAPFSFNLVATPQDAPEFPVSAPGSLLARSQSINVDQLTATPQFANPGTPITISARVFAVVNEAVSAQLQLNITNASGGNAGQFYSNTFTLSPTSTVQTITFNPVDTTNFTNGAYTLSVFAEFGNIPQGAAATGSLTIGSPLSGVLTATPSVVGPGSSTVQASLTINRDTAQNPVSTLVGTVLVNGIPRSMALYTNGSQKLAYVCSDSQVNIVDVTNSASPVVLSTFANSLLTQSGAATGFTGVICSIYNSDLIVTYSRQEGNISTDPAAVPTYFAIFSLANPLSPVQLGSTTTIERPDSAGGMYLVGTSALLIQNDDIYNPFSNFIFQENGDVWALDLTNANTGSVAFQSDLYPCGGINSTTNACNDGTTVYGNFVPNDQYRGGPYPMHSGTEVNSTTAYFTSSSSSGGNTEEPGLPAFNGQLLVVDDTNPAALNILTKVDVPQSAILTDVAIQGNTAVAVGDSTGIYDINSGYVGTLVIASFDITNPHSPVLLNTVVTALTDKPGATVVPLGNNTFAVGGTSNNGTGSLVLVDASNPSALRYVPYNALFVASPEIANPPYFYTLSGTPSATTNSLSIFQLSTITGPQLSVSLQIPTTGNASLVAGSFNQTPSSSTPGTGYTTYVWNQPSLNTITFNMNLTGVNPGDVTTLVNGGQMSFTLPTLGAGTLQLGGLSVLTQHILSISPTTQSVNNGGQAVNYTATITNPTNTSQTFNLSGIVPPGWTAAVQPSIVVGAGGSQSFNVAVTAPANAQASAVTFNVAANSTGGISDSVPAQLSVIYGGANLGGGGGTAFSAFTASVSPSQVTAGQGDNSQPFTFTVTNTGNGTNTIQLGYPTTLPTNWSVGTYTPAYYVTLQPNATALITETISVPRGTTPGPYQVTIPVQENGAATQSLSVTVTVSGAGVGGYISPNTGPPTSGFLVALTNFGTAPDTFNLSVVGPFAQTASIQSSVTLASSAEVNVPITFNSPNYVAESNALLQIKAVSQSNSNVQYLMAATVTVPSSKIVSSSILPSSTTVNPTPGTANLLFDADNLGNVADSYSAQITNLTGPVTASLVNSAGQAVQSISPFYITALGTAQIPLNAAVTGSGTSTVTVKVTSLTTPTVTSSSTVTISGGTTTAPSAPVLISPASDSIGISLSAALSWNAAAGAASYDVYFGTSSPPSFLANTTNTTYSPGTLAATTNYHWYVVAKNTVGTAASPTWSFETQAPASGLQFYPVTPCRLVDTRGAAAGFNGIAPFSGPSIASGVTVTIPVQSALEAGTNTTPTPCGTIPSTAQAYSLNVTVVPHIVSTDQYPGVVDFISLWPSGAAQPTVSTLNDTQGQILANAAIVPAGNPSGGISIYNSGPAAADVILDLNGYFASTTTQGSATGLQFYPVSPCRLVDMRGASAGFNGISPFSGPALSSGATANIPVQSSSEAAADTTPAPCGTIPSGAQAYSLNTTLVPQAGVLDHFITLWPSGAAQPTVSTLNDQQGEVVANAAIVPAGTPSGGVSVFNEGPATADIILDLNGYFAAPTGLKFYPVSPCRLVDTRGTSAGFNGISPFSGPAIAAGATITIPVQSAAEAAANTTPAPCGTIPSTAQAYSLNLTVVPQIVSTDAYPGMINFVTIWPAGVAQPTVSTLNDQEALIVANAAIVPAGSGSGGISVYNSGPSATHVVIDMNGYFAP